jgi:uncharacterized protein (DUF934 family)
MTDLPIDDETLEQWLGELDEKKARIREQSRTVATYIQAQNEITNLLDTLEGFHLLRERFCDDVDRRDYKEIEKWLIEAWKLGYEAGCNTD